MPEEKHYITWEQFHKDCQKLADQIKARKKEYAGILAVARGGLPVAGILSQLLDIRNIHTGCLQSYTGDNNQEEVTSVYDSPYLSWNLMNENSFLIVDDLVDSGNTLKYLDNLLGPQDSAVPYRKDKTEFEPTYFVENIPAERWIVFPWEIT